MRAASLAARSMDQAAVWGTRCSWSGWSLCGTSWTRRRAWHPTASPSAGSTPARRAPCHARACAVCSASPQRLAGRGAACEPAVVGTLPLFCQRARSHACGHQLPCNASSQAVRLTHHFHAMSYGRQIRRRRWTLQGVWRLSPVRKARRASCGTTCWWAPTASTAEFGARTEPQLTFHLARLLVLLEHQHPGQVRVLSSYTPIRSCLSIAELHGQTGAWTCA